MMMMMLNGTIITFDVYPFIVHFLFSQVSLLVSSVYILLGMALISTVFNLVQEEIVRSKTGRGRQYHRPIS